MSWRHLARGAQDVMVRTFAERDGANQPTTEYSPDGTTWVPLLAIFEDGWLEVLLENQTTASVREIRADVRIEDLPAYPPTPAARFRIQRPLEGDPMDDSAATVFVIYDHRPDGQGLVRFLLRREGAP